jgi:hypothetical protein
LQEADVSVALSAYERGSAKEAPSIPNFDERYGARYVVELTGRLPEREAALLVEATRLREAALKRAREGDLVMAAEGLDAASTMVARGAVCEEASTSARSFQAAAEAFVDHLRGDHENARALLFEALTLCFRLRTEFGHSVEVRRVHLARNIVRLTWMQGKYPDAIALALALLAYVFNGAGWPLPETGCIPPEQRERLRNDEQHFLSDQVLSEVASLVLHALKSKHSIDAENLVYELPQDLSSCVQLCLRSNRPLRTQMIDFVEIFEAGPGHHPHTWKKLVDLFSHITTIPIEQLREA